MIRQYRISWYTIYKFTESIEIFGLITPYLFKRCYKV